MRVTLAYPYQGRKADTTITVDDHVGRNLIRAGRARPATGPAGDASVAELRAYADKAGIDLGGAKKKTDILAAIEAAEQTRVTTTTVLPAPGTDIEGA